MIPYSGSFADCFAFGASIRFDDFYCIYTYIIYILYIYQYIKIYIYVNVYYNIYYILYIYHIYQLLISFMLFSYLF